jgi:hypothetical protein
LLTRRVKLGSLLRSRWAQRFAVCALIACGAPAQGQVASLQTINRAEEVGWADPDRGLRMLEELESRATNSQALGR